MKKIFIVLALASILGVYRSNGFVNATSAYNGEYTVYSSGLIQDLMGQLAPKEEMTFSQSWQLQLERLKSRDIKGESVKFVGNDSDIKSLIEKLKIKIFQAQTINGVETMFGYSSRLRGGVVVDGRKVNVQIAKNRNIVTVGTPVIFGSY